jgi:hypothetical protein
LRSAFPRELERRLETAFATKGVPRPIEPVSLEVLAVRYGSLEFLVGGAGVAAFASMVQSVGPAVALMLIEACVQDSLEATFDVSARDATVQLRSGSFGAPPSTAGPGTGAAQGTWGQVLSAAPKVFWLLPTLLALIVLWVELTGVHSHMERIARRETELGKMQEALSATWEARIKQLEALNADLVKQLRVPPADQKESTACGCIPCCVNPPACPPSPPDPPRAGTPRRLPSCKQR